MSHAPMTRSDKQNHEKDVIDFPLGGVASNILTNKHGKRVRAY